LISIVVSSYKKENYAQFAKNVDETIGVPYEIIRIDNPGVMGICKAYNLGSNKANFKFICFSHEDILFKTENWGKEVIRLFDENSQLGLLGVAGSDYKTVAPGPFFCSDMDRVFMNITQCYKKQNQSPKPFKVNPTGADYAEVVCVDGVWFCTTKEVLSKVKFDEATFSSFHCYDVDFSLSVFKSFKVAVTYKILIEHFSEGSFDKTWTEETLKLFSKWKDVLPLSVRPYPDPKPIKLEAKTLVDFFISMYENSFSPFKMVKVYRLVSPSIPFSLKDKVYLYYILCKQFVKYCIGYQQSNMQAN